MFDLDPTDPDSHWWRPFPAQVSAVTNTNGTYFYTWNEVASSASTGNYSAQDRPRRGSPTTSPAREINNRNVTSPGNAVVRMWFRGMVNGEPVYEFDGSGIVAGECCSCESEDLLSSPIVVTGADYWTIPLSETVGSLSVVGLTYVGTGITPPSGWTVILNDTANGIWLGWRVCEAAGESGTFTVTGGGAAADGCRFLSISNATVETSASGSGTGTTLTAPTVTSSGSDRRLLVFWVIDSGTATIPSSMATFGYGNGAASYRFWAETVGSGATGTRAATLSGSTDWVAVSLILGAGTGVSGTAWDGGSLVCGKVVTAGDPGDAVTSLTTLTPSANTIPYYTSNTAAALTTLTSYARTLLDDADAATARATLGVTADLATFSVVGGL